jgi:hypothetical protein
MVDFDAKKLKREFCIDFAYFGSFFIEIELPKPFWKFEIGVPKP